MVKWEELWGFSHGKLCKRTDRLVTKIEALILYTRLLIHLVQQMKWGGNGAIKTLNDRTFSPPGQVAQLGKEWRLGARL